jgi:hypothetical protein
MWEEKGERRREKDDKGREREAKKEFLHRQPRREQRR